MSKQLNAKEINEQLLKVQQIWHEKLYSEVKKDYKAHAEEKGKLSCAFSFGVSEHYAESKKKIMIVGQEANKHYFDDDYWDKLENWQEWAIAYLDYQIYDEKHSELLRKNNSPFWQFIKKLKKKGFGVCWNNIDKVRRYIFNEENKEVEDWLLEREQGDANKDRGILHGKIFDGKSLLQKEIEIAKPDMVVFAVGPDNPYYHSLSLAFFKDDEEVDEHLNMKGIKYPQLKGGNYCLDIGRALGLRIPAFYTYHPNCLNWQHRLDNVVNLINDYKK